MDESLSVQIGVGIASSSSSISLDSEPPVIYGMYHTHMRVHSQCGACGELVDIKDRVLAILGPDRSPPYEVRNLDRFYTPSFPKGWTRCNHAINDCTHCQTSGECATVHADCFHLYRALRPGKKALHDLWKAATWRYPWRWFDYDVPAPSPDLAVGLSLAARFCPKLANIPLDVGRIIWNYLGDSHILYRFASVTALTQMMSWEPPEPIRSPFPLCEIRSWRRGQVPDTGTADRKPFMRLTIDSFGLEAIEQLSEMPKRRVCQSKNNTRSFVVQNMDNFFGVLFQFENGLSRLIVPSGTDWPYPGMRVWDTSHPPLPENMAVFPRGRPLPAPGHFVTIDTRLCFGLTFLLSEQCVYAIHPHTPARPDASETLERASRYLALIDASWVYVPLPEGDPIIAFGVRRLRSRNENRRSTTSTLLFRFKKSGDLVIGPRYDFATHDQIQRTEENPTIFYHAMEREGIWTTGVYPISRDAEPIREITHPQWADMVWPRVPSRIPCFSWASLDDVAAAEVFFDDNTGFCHGVLFEYRDKTQRSVGQCRLGLDPSHRYDDPAVVSFSRGTQQQGIYSTHQHWVKIEFDGCQGQPVTQSQGLADREWWNRKMCGYILFWFTEENTLVQFK